jgi:hypothetical protein
MQEPFFQFGKESSLVEMPHIAMPTTSPHTLKAATPHNPEDFEPQHDYDPDTIVIPPPPRDSYYPMFHWITKYFPGLISHDFISFLVKDLGISSIHELSNFVDYLAYTDTWILCDSIGPATFHKHGPSMNNLKHIWLFIWKYYYGPGKPPIVKEVDFLCHWIHEIYRHSHLSFHGNVSVWDPIRWIPSQEFQDRTIPAPPPLDGCYIRMFTWLKCYFDPYVSADLFMFLIGDLHLESLSALSHYLLNEEDLESPAKFPVKFQPFIYDLIVIWSFIEDWQAQGPVSMRYNDFLQYQAENFRSSTAYVRPIKQSASMIPPVPPPSYHEPKISRPSSSSVSSIPRRVLPTMELTYKKGFHPGHLPRSVSLDIRTERMRMNSQNVIVNPPVRRKRRMNSQPITVTPFCRRGGMTRQNVTSKNPTSLRRSPYSKTLEHLLRGPCNTNSTQQQPLKQSKPPKGRYTKALEHLVPQQGHRALKRFMYPIIEDDCQEEDLSSVNEDVPDGTRNAVMLEDSVMIQEDVPDAPEIIVTVPSLSEENTEDIDDPSQSQDLLTPHHDKGSACAPEACLVEKESTVESPAEKGSVLEFPEIDLSDQESFYDCISSMSTIPTEGTVPNEEFFECSSVLSPHVPDVQCDKVPCSVHIKVTLSKNTPCPVFYDFKIPLLFVKQGDLPCLTRPWNPAQILPTVEKKTEPVQDPIPRVKLKTYP